MPRRRTASFAVARLNFLEWKGGLEDLAGKNEFLLRQLLAGKEYIKYRGKEERPQFTWFIADLFHNQTDGIVTGRLVRQRSEVSNVTVDPRERRLVFRPGQETTTWQISSFGIHLNSHIIIFEERGEIRERDFRFAFQQVLNPNRYARESPIQVDLVVSEEEVFAFIERVQRVTSMSVKIVPSNPRPRRGKASVDNALKRMNAEAGRIEIKSEEGLDFDSGQGEGGEEEINPFVDALYQAADGYGSVQLAGIEDNRPAKFSSAINYLRAFLPGAKDDEPGFFGRLTEKLLEVLALVDRDRTAEEPD